MLESAFRTSVLSKLEKHIHRQPMLAGALGTAGTPDTYVDYNRDLWVEWKCLRREDYLPSVIPKEGMPTDLQKLWLNRRYAAGKNAIVIVGIKLRGRAYGFVLDSPESWSSSPRKDQYESLLCPASELAAYITRRVT
jgi:hypothetical protein